MLPLLSSKVSGLGLSSAIGIREREDMNVNECSDAIKSTLPQSILPFSGFVDFVAMIKRMAEERDIVPIF